MSTINYVLVWNSGTREITVRMIDYPGPPNTTSQTLNCSGPTLTMTEPPHSGRVYDRLGKATDED